MSEERPFAEAFDDDFDRDCDQCGGEGYVYDCIDGMCVNAEDGCVACMMRCDFCNPSHKGRPMTRYPYFWPLERLVDYCNRGETQAGLSDGRWVPARPLGFCSIGNRIRCAWAVFTGRADAVEWPDQ